MTPEAEDLQVRPGPSEDDPYEVRRFDPASGEWSTWVEQGEFIKRTRGEAGSREMVKRIRDMIKAAHEKAVSMPRSAERASEGLSLEEKVDRLKAYLQEHPTTRLMDLELHRDPERGPLYILAKKLLQRGELLEHPKTKALSFRGQGPAAAEISVRILEDLPAIRDAEGNDRKLIKGELVRLPDSTAKALLRKGKAEEALDINPEPVSLATAKPAPREEASRPSEDLELVPSGPAEVSGSCEAPAVHPAIAEAERINNLLARGRDNAEEAKIIEPQTPEPVHVCSGYSIDLAEPFIDDDGSPAVAVIWNGQHLKLWKLSEWKDAEPSLYKDLSKRFFPEKGQRWKYPSRPVLPESYEDIGKLHAAIMRCNEIYVEFPNPAWPSVFATWIIGSYLVPFLPRSPILPIFGPTSSGKGQVLDQVDRLAYRGKKMIDPTPAVLYRLADRWGLTFALDELQDKDKDSFREVLSIVKGSYDGTSVYRCDTNNDVEEFQTRSFFALSFKDHHPREDVKNRGILLTMQQNGAARSLVPEDSPEHIELRSRLIGLRLKALSDPQFLKEAVKTVQELGTPEALGFDRRPRDIAVSLLLPAAMSHQEEKLVEIVRESGTEARDANNSTFEAMTQHAYEELVRGLRTVVRYYPVLTIRAHLEELLRADGELRDDQSLPTRRVTNALKTLGYEIVRRTGNNPFIDREAERNIKAFEINRGKYAIGEDDTEAF